MRNGRNASVNPEVPMSPAECAAFSRAWTDEVIKTTGTTDSAQAWARDYNEIKVVGSATSNARLYAAVTAAMNDAEIAVFEAK